MKSQVKLSAKTQIEQHDDGVMPLRYNILIFIIILTATLLSSACFSEKKETVISSDAEMQMTEEVPLVTLKNWRDSTPGERYSFLIGFVTMLELEKEWQGRVGGEILPFEKSLVKSWVKGFAERPLKEIYNGLNKYITEHQDELEKPVVETMWFIFVQPRNNEEALNSLPSQTDD